METNINRYSQDSLLPPPLYSSIMVSHPLLAHPLSCATDGRVAVSDALLVSLDLLSQPALHAVTAALYQAVSLLFETR